MATWITFQATKSCKTPIALLSGSLISDTSKAPERCISWSCSCRITSISIGNIYLCNTPRFLSIQMPVDLEALSSSRIPMRHLVKANVASVPFVVGTLLFLSALTFYYFAVLRVDYYKTTLLDLAPHPDATEYLAQAKSLRRDAWPYIQIGYDKLPSRYPFGYPILMLPWMKILSGQDSVLAPFRTNQTLGLLLLFAVFAFYAYLAMPLTGGFAALLLATLPGFFTFCRSSMSDISASVFIVLAFMFAYLGLKEERRWKIYLSAVFLGLSLNIRVQSAFFAPLLLAMAVLPMRGARV